MLENLRKLRGSASVSQKQLAEAVGVSQQSINKYENHNIEPDIETMIRIAKYFNTSVDYLIGYSTIPHKAERLLTYELNDEECDLVNRFRKLSKQQRQCILTLINSYLN